MGVTPLLAFMAESPDDYGSIGVWAKRKRKRAGTSPSLHPFGAAPGLRARRRPRRQPRRFMAKINIARSFAEPFQTRFVQLCPVMSSYLQSKNIFLMNAHSKPNDLRDRASSSGGNAFSSRRASAGARARAKARGAIK